MLNKHKTQCLYTINCAHFKEVNKKHLIFEHLHITSYLKAVYDLSIQFYMRVGISRERTQRTSFAIASASSHKYHFQLQGPKPKRTREYLKCQ